HPMGGHGGLHLLHIGPRDLANGATAGQATVLDLTLGWRWTVWRLDLQVDNLLNSPWREGEYHFASWWNRNETRSQLPVIHVVAGEPRTARLTLGAVF
ncbi:MAG: TonB-dependent receptor, partial [Myxococcota bacterium]